MSQILWGIGDEVRRGCRIHYLSWWGRGMRWGWDQCSRNRPRRPPRCWSAELWLNLGQSSYLRQGGFRRPLRHLVGGLGGCKSQACCNSHNKSETFNVVRSSKASTILCSLSSVNKWEREIRYLTFNLKWRELQIHLFSLKLWNEEWLWKG